jgi:hypothetical protein
MTAYLIKTAKARENEPELSVKKPVQTPIGVIFSINLKKGCQTY